MYELNSERLFYRSISLEYCTNSYVSWMNDFEVIKYLETGGNYTIEKLTEYINNVINTKLFFLAIHTKENGKHIGNIKIDPINTKHGYGEYGILMGDKSEWGKGYAFEASMTVIDFSFKILGLRKICLGVVNENYPAMNLYKKLGFKVEGVYKNHGIYNGKYLDIIRMALFNPNLNFSE